MYPETDLQLLKISRKLIDETKKNLPKLSSENKSYLKEFGLNDELIKLVLKQDQVEEFKTLSKIIDNPELIAKSLAIFKKEITKKENKTERQINELLNLHTIEAVLEEVGKKISKNDVKNVFQKIVQGKSLKESFQKSEINLKKEIQDLIKEKPNLSRGAYMGLIMNKFKGQINGKEVNEELEIILK
jgi:Glu-tRNA(Gln) amidotransferase subunit E-like FAD-binding protein